MPKRSPGARTVTDALDAELAELAKRAPALAESALAASARVLARELDKERNSATSKSMCQKALSETLDRLRELAPAKDEKDTLDDLSARRAARRTAGATGT